MKFVIGGRRILSLFALCFSLGFVFESAHGFEKVRMCKGLFWEYRPSIAKGQSTFGLPQKDIQFGYENWSRGDVDKFVGRPLRFSFYDSNWPLGFGYGSHVLIHSRSSFSSTERATMNILLEAHRKEETLARARDVYELQLREGYPESSLGTVAKQLTVLLERQPEHAEAARHLDFIRAGRFYELAASDAVKEGVEVGIYIIRFKDGTDMLSKTTTSFHPDQIRHSGFEFLQTLRINWWEVSEVQFFHVHPGHKPGNVLVSYSDITSQMKLAHMVQKHLMNSGRSPDEMPDILFSIFAFVGGIRDSPVGHFGVTMSEYRQYLQTTIGQKIELYLKQSEQ